MANEARRLRSTLPDSASHLSLQGKTEKRKEKNRVKCREFLETQLPGKCVEKQHVQHTLWFIHPPPPKSRPCATQRLKYEALCRCPGFHCSERLLFSRPKRHRGGGFSDVALCHVRTPKTSPHLFVPFHFNVAFLPIQRISFFVNDDPRLPWLFRCHVASLMK